MIIHILKDGRQLDDITDHTVQINDKTTKAYEILAESAKGETNEDN